MPSITVISMVVAASCRERVHFSGCSAALRTAPFVIERTYAVRMSSLSSGTKGASRSRIIVRIRISRFFEKLPDAVVVVRTSEETQACAFHLK